MFASVYYNIVSLLVTTVSCLSKSDAFMHIKVDLPQRWNADLRPRLQIPRTKALNVAT